MRWWPLILGVVAGCGFEHGVTTTDGAMPDMPSAADEDGDGIDDAIDNCIAVSNPDQRDHDGDGRGDQCDLCPHLASTSDPDGDGDGVGDACDPRPSSAGDRRVLWEGFYDANAVDTWTQGGAAANWVVLNGAVQQPAFSPGDRVLLPPTSYQHVYVATSFEILGVSASATLGVCSGVAAPQFYCCTLRSAGPSVLSSSHIEAQSAQWTGTYNIGSKIQLVQNTASTNRCEASQQAIMTSRTSALGSTEGGVQLYTASASAAYDYLFIVEIGN